MDIGFSLGPGAEIGKGSFARVYRARRHVDGKEDALKVFQASQLTAEGRKQLLNEAALLAALDHPHIVKFHEAFVTDNQQTVCVVMELLEGGTLARFLRHLAGKQSHLPEAAIWRFFLQLATAVQYLHASRVCHRDLKPANILFAATGALKLADFGLSKLMRQDLTNSTVGTPLYAAPEIFKKQPYSYPCDVWALGCIAHELATLAPAFEAPSTRGVRFNVLQGTTAPIPEWYSQDLRDVIAAMLQPDPAQRITIDLLLTLSTVASRLRDLQQTGLVDRQTLGQLSPPGNHVRPQAVTDSLLLESRCSLEVTGLGTLAELLPTPRYSGERQAAVPPARVALATASSFYSSSGGSNEADMSAADSEVRQQAAVLQALLRCCPFVGRKPVAAEGNAAIIHVDATHGGAAPCAAAASQSIAPHCSEATADLAADLGDSRHATAPAWLAPAGRPGPAPIQVHPKYAAMVAAAGYATIQPRSPPPPPSPAKAPATPQPASKGAGRNAYAASRLGAAAGNAVGRVSQPVAPAGSSQSNFGLRGSTGGAQRAREVAHAMVASVTANLAREEALQLGRLAAKLSRVNSAALDSPTLRGALLEAAMVMRETEQVAALAWKRPMAGSPRMGAGRGATWTVEPQTLAQDAPAAGDAHLAHDGLTLPPSALAAALAPSVANEQEAAPGAAAEVPAAKPGAEPTPSKPNRRWSISNLMRCLTSLK